MSANYVLVLGDREPLAWVLTSGRMAFPTHRVRQASALSVGDRLFMYTTRGCFHNTMRDRGRVIGEATVTQAVSALEAPVEFDGQSFPLGCRLRVTGLAPKGDGLDFAGIVSTLHLFPDSGMWAIRLRRVLVPLDAHDAEILHRRLDKVIRPLRENREGYLAKTTFA